MSNQILMFDLLTELSIESQEFLVGGQGLPVPPGQQGPPVPPGQQEQQGLPQRSRGATGYIVPDNNPENYFSWRLDPAPTPAPTPAQGQ